MNYIKAARVYLQATGAVWMIIGILNSNTLSLAFGFIDIVVSALAALIEDDYVQHKEEKS